MNDKEKEINLLKIKLEKILESQHPDYASAIDIFELLKGFDINTEILKKTSIGKICNRFTKVTHESTVAAANKLVESWKNAVVASKTINIATPTINTPQKPQAVKVESGTSTQSTTKSSPTNSESLATNVPEKFNPTTNDKFRNKIQELLFSLLGEKFSDTDIEPSILAVSIEAELTKKFQSGSEEYKEKYRVIAQNLRDVSNQDFNMRLLCGEIKPSELMIMSSSDMASDAQKAKLKEIDEWNQAACRSDIPLTKGNMTDEYKCPRCKQRKCNYYQKQTRSADEPMTTFITCTVCGKRWRD